MRSFSLAVTALIGVTAANPRVWPRNYRPVNPYPTVPSSSSSTPSSTEGGEYPHPGPTGGNTYPPYPPHSTDVTDYSHPGPTGGNTYPPGGPSTEVLTTYTTTTVCPVTETHGTKVITSLTTSVITITSCKAGCHHEPTPTPGPNPGPGDSNYPVTVPTTITTTTFTWVPCSTSVGHSGPSVIYSSFLTPSYYPTTYVTDVLVYPTPKPESPDVTPASPEHPPVYTPGTPQPPVETPGAPHPPTVTPAPENPPVYPPGTPEECPAPVTITVTVGGGAEPCHACETKTYTITEHGTATTFTVTVTPEATGPVNTPHSTPYGPNPPHSTPYGPNPPVGPTGGSSTGVPHPTGYIPYPSDASSMSYSSSHEGPKPTDYYTY
ncbi:hypothetical protein BDV95DRAFT_118302 [Massariosphaeria phaeospora]|uniref:Uncharacterized protein n=1 Tax=Massariosphaeria phaeospora TaxID=100035 RepID=A0A7C8M4Q0_9PLEO|nr:hypothetical protein BDV95DRAFT_118302 [Massariosphaeria phaeospora]